MAKSLEWQGAGVSRKRWHAPVSVLAMGTVRQINSIIGNKGVMSDACGERGHRCMLLNYI